MTSKLQLKVVSQEKQLLEMEVDSITAETTMGEVTILPQHSALFTQLDTGELVYRDGETEHSLVISKGFMDVHGGNEVTVMADTAVTAREISEEKAQAAINQAHETMKNSQDRQELLMAEASLKLAMLELRVARKSKKSTI